MKANNHGLSDKQLDTIANILFRNCPDIENVSLFGLRATGNYKRYSDIDLVVYGDIKQSVADRLWTLFHESPLPYKVDIQVFNLIKYPPLRRHIEDKAKTLFTKEQIDSHKSHGSQQIE